jgi:hypothetical protein
LSLNLRPGRIFIINPKDENTKNGLSFFGMRDRIYQYLYDYDDAI